MKDTWTDIKIRAMAFSQRWRDARSEVAESQPFVTALLKVFGVEDPLLVGQFEYKIVNSDDHSRYVDYLWPKKIAIEMKSRGESLENALIQLENYMKLLPPELTPNLWLVSNFEYMHVKRISSKQKVTFPTLELSKKVKYFADITDFSTERDYDYQIEANVKAAEKMAKLHDSLESLGYVGHELEIYLVRLLFCLFADSTDIFRDHAFLEYVEASKKDGSDLSSRLGILFEILNMPGEVRSSRPHLSPELKKFQYIDGSLFSELLHTPDFDAPTYKTLLDCCANFDWSSISPAVFGSMFQGIMDKNNRRLLGAHYTSEENILKLIKPLFLDKLWSEFEILKVGTKQNLDAFHVKLSKLKFFDPACGCGNFLIVAYREIRKLESEVLKYQFEGDGKVVELENFVKVNVNQFYGIEYLEFPSQIAQVGMWLCDHQMNIALSERFSSYFVRLPLKAKAEIVHGNALRMNWDEIIPNKEIDYIFGNPPFIGSKIRSDEQKADMEYVFSGTKGWGNLDYVASWYKKSFDYIKGTKIKCAFVSTNSIAQGEQPALLWKPLMEDGAHINFGLPTFKWTNEAKGQAAVHCVIIGFSNEASKSELNQYLLNGPAIFVESRKRPLCDVPQIGIGCKPIDGGNYLFYEEEKNDFIKKEPKSEKWFRQWMGAKEFINGYSRFFLLLKDCPRHELRLLPECLKLVEAVKESRSNSQSPGTVKLANNPLAFHVENSPDCRYIAIPEASSERRRYIPMAFLEPTIIPSNQLLVIPGATFYHFGVLTSDIHMAWVKKIGGRLKSDYRYSKHIVYNNFPWPNPNAKQIAAVEATAQAIIDARNKYPEDSLADLYDHRDIMPNELLKAHQANDNAVFKSYGFTMKNRTDETYIKALLKLYQSLTS
jgi:hypothetical protein